MNKAVEIVRKLCSQFCFTQLITWYQECFCVVQSITDMEKIEPPKELDMDSQNLAETWREWQESWKLYEISSGLSKKDEKVQVATLLSVIGVKARRVLKTLPNIPENLENRKVKDTLKALKDYCMSRTNVTYERYIFRTTT